MNRQQLLDLYFLEARSKVIDLAAYLDRVERAPGEADFRQRALQQALAELQQTGPDRARRVLLSLSDPTTEPAPTAVAKGACGAWIGRS